MNNWKPSSFKQILLLLCNSIVLILCEIILSGRNNFTNDEHVFLSILVTNFRVLCFEDLCYTHYVYTVLSKYRLNLVSEICLVNILTFPA